MRIKLVCSKCSAVLLFCLLALVARAEEKTSFVSVKDGKFYLQGKEYRYVGTNLWYGAILGSEGQGGNRKRLIQELEDMRAVGIDNVRVLIGGDGRDGIPSHQSLTILIRLSCISVDACHHLSNMLCS